MVVKRIYTSPATVAAGRSAIGSPTVSGHYSPPRGAGSLATPPLAAFAGVRWFGGSPLLPRAHLDSGELEVLRRLGDAALIVGGGDFAGK